MAANVIVKSSVEKKMYIPKAYHPYRFMRNLSFWPRLASSGSGVSGGGGGDDDDDDDEELEVFVEYNLVRGVYLCVKSPGLAIANEVAARSRYRGKVELERPRRVTGRNTGNLPTSRDMLSSELVKVR
jgi:hypothetical protein